LLIITDRIARSGNRAKVFPSIIRDVGFVEVFWKNFKLTLNLDARKKAVLSNLKCIKELNWQRLARFKVNYLNWNAEVFGDLWCRIKIIALMSMDAELTERLVHPPVER